MKKKEMKTKAMAVAMSATMAASICPAVPAMAVTKDQVAKDGVYTKTAHVTRTEADVDDEWDEYDVEVSLTVKDGKFSDITVTPGEGYTDENKTYLAKAYSKSKGIQTLLKDKDATEDTINGWDTVSGATRSSTAIKKAALEAIQSAPVAEAPVTVDTSALEKSIEQAKALNESDYTAETWSVLKEKLAAAETAVSEKKSQDAVDTAKNELDAAIAGLKKAEVAKEVYVLMNIPYNAFYQADTNSKTDAVSSATLQKTRVSGLAGGSYHVDPEGSDISGVTFPVKISSDALKNYKQVTDDSKVSITTSVKGNTSTTEYTGKDALFESENYSYYILSEEPSYYKEASVESDGTLSFGKVIGTAQTLSDATGEFSTETRYGDYELDMTGLPDSISKVYGVVIGTKEGDKYGLRHVENIWKKKELAWSTGFVTESHGNQLSYENYKAMMGQTINQVTYYTDAGIYEIPVNIYVPVKFSGEVKVEDTELESGETTYTVSGIPDDYEAQYSVKGLKDVKAKDGKLTFDSKDATPGQYTLTISDKSGKYADITTKFLLTTDKVPVSYDEESNGLVPAEKYSQNDADAYVKNISSVTVNGEKYAATGKGSVKIIKEDGTLDTTAKPFADAKDGDKYEITVASTGYTTDYDFTYTVNDQNEYKYVYAGLTWAEYWAAEGVQAAGDASSSEAVDTKGESDKGAFDVVTRATTNHGLHRGSYQCSSVIYMKDGSTYSVAYYPEADSRTTAVLTNGQKVTYNTEDIDHYIVTGLKYVPVKVAAADYEAFAQKYAVVENGSELTGGFSEGNLSSYSGITANVTENTNGLKTATKNEDGSFSFSARETGTESGITGQELKTAPTAEDAGLTVKEAKGSYGEFLRVDLTQNYGDLGANMQAVKWTYYGDDSTYSNAKATYGTKFASDNWMHKSMGIQLGLTDSLRCTLPEGTDGTGYWTITISALGYNDVTYQFQATDENIVKPDAGEINTANLEAAIAKAEALNKDEYTEASWEAMQVELKEAKEELEAKHSQATVDEATEHLNAAIDALEKSETPAEVDTAKLEASIAVAEGLKEADYTADSWKAMQNALATAKAALEAKESQTAVDSAAEALDSAVAALVKADSEDPVKEVSTDALEKAISTAEGLKESDYTADSWKALQSALTSAKTALAEKKDQTSVDAATENLNKAISALVKASSTSGSTTTTTGTSGTKTGTTGSKTSGTATGSNSSTKAAKTGDPAGVLGWLGLAVSSLGAGIGGFKLKRRRDEEEK